MNDFRNLLESYGADPDALLSFEKAGPDLLPYATLLGACDSDSDLAVLLGVYEWQRSPLIFFLNGDELGDDGNRLRRVRRMLALRGDAPYLGVVKPGQLALYRLSLDAHSPAQARIPLPEGDQRATLAYLGNQRPDLPGARRKWVADVVLKLLNAAIDTLKTQANVGDDDAISLVGRALFTRFLGDRDLIAPIPGARTEVAHLFDDAASAAATSIWLDETFNGDFLPLSDGLFSRLPASTFKTLGDVMRRAARGQLHLEWHESWAYLDFAHIPVGVLSQAYENHLSKRPHKQRKEGGYYTPRPIAELMVRGAFHALRTDGCAHTARVLDPAAGAGVFLLTAFRQLVAERWHHDDRRPDTDTLRAILYGQITGFDINESALRFAALGLYLLSIELDPHPEPVAGLKFENLRDTVLFKVGEDSDDTPSTSLGSLGEAVGTEHLGRYDLVIGNPPWSSATKLGDWETVKTTVARIACGRLPEDSPAPPLPNEVMDLPFVWRAMEWARPGGQIAFALHARLLFQQGDGMPLARSSLFSALKTTGLINGAELRHTKVWPGIAAPFCLLFARNQLPSPGSAFRFVSPHEEISLNDAGGMRVDVANAEWVSSEQVAQRPELLKILFRGGALDLEVFDRMAGRGIGTLEDYWRQRFDCPKGRLRFAGNGYQRLRKSSRVRKQGDGKPGVSAAYLADLPELTAQAARSLLVYADPLQKFHQQRIHDPRPRSLFQGPLLIIYKSPPAGAGRVRSAVSDADLVFNTTYYGFGTHQHPNGPLLARYLALIVGSRPAFWHILVTSGAFGFERDVVEQLTIENIPVPPFEALTDTQRNQITPLFDAIVRHDSEANWARVDAWVAELYGLSRSDLQIIDDTLAYNLPFAANRKAAQANPRDREVEAFHATLAEELAPWAKRFGLTLEISPSKPAAASPWRLLQVSGTPQAASSAAPPWPEFFRAADRLAASEILLPQPETGTLWVGRLNQARYWSRSQARLLARRIVWEHLQALTGRA